MPVMTDDAAPFGDPRVAESEQTTAFPEQYEGILADGRPFYFRYCNGWASLGIGDRYLGGGQEAWVGFGGQFDCYFENGDDRDRIFRQLLDELAKEGESP